MILELPASELPMRTALTTLLRGAGFLVSTSADGESGLAQALDESPGLILLDAMLPRLDGFAVCQELRARRRDTLILMLTAKGFVDDRVRGLDAGADDFLVKPFSQKELMARINALLRRLTRESQRRRDVPFGEVVVNFERETCTRSGRVVELTAKEFRMLRLPAEADGKPVTRDQFLDVVWEYNAFLTTRTIDTHMASLRAKLEREPSAPLHLLTVHRVGYRLLVSE